MGDLFLNGTSPVGLIISTLLSRNFFWVVFISHRFMLMLGRMGEGFQRFSTMALA